MVMNNFEFRPLDILSWEKKFVVKENKNKWEINFKNEEMDDIKTIVFYPLIKGNVVEWFYFYFICVMI
jgi:hypothetical protein